MRGRHLCGGTSSMRENVIYGIYGCDSNKQTRFISNLAIDDKPLTSATGARHRAPSRAAPSVATTYNDIYGIYGAESSKQTRFVSNLAIDDRLLSSMLAERFRNAPGHAHAARTAMGKTTSMRVPAREPLCPVGRAAAVRAREREVI